MKRLKELLKLLEPALDAGIELAVGKEDGQYYVNLDTGMKSECVIWVTPTRFEARGRYGAIEFIDTWDDVLYVVEQCQHGRPFGNTLWLELIR